MEKILKEFTSTGRNIISSVLPWRGSDLGNASLLSKRLHDVPQAIKDWKESSCRAGARTALSMVMAHYPGVEIREVTESVPDLDEEGRKIDHNAIWRDVGGFASRVAGIANIDSYQSFIPLPSYQDDESPSSEEDMEKVKDLQSGSAEAVNSDTKESSAE